ncbi:MAG: thiamine phosphate synthase [Planctomycetaceae bacterium]|nr:thiamine phosphate synthase [Planctomycetaceae bacterium]|tara:strand:- start:2647 stop:3729 length:1083 start_codon:yes stop_codon:yes gene_type:complete
MPDEQNTVLRIIDANLNRSFEALRTIEEYTRFILDEQILTKTVKQMRHELQGLAQQISFEQRILARDSAGDVGRSVTTSSEYQRDSVSQVVLAAFGRLKQSLRALEEYSKVIAAELGGAFERLRYQTYDLEKLLISQQTVKGIFKSLTVYGLVTGGKSTTDFQSHVSALLQSGIDILQLRDKQLDDRSLVARARQMRKLVDREIERSGRPVLMIINDRLDIACVAKADGVHLGQTEIRVEDARRILGNQFLIGVSTHNPEQVEQAVQEGADYIGCGPTFPSSTKEFSDFAGTEFLAWVASNCSLPAFAIGGIDMGNIQEIADAGFSRVAVSGCIGPEDDHRSVIESLKNILTSNLLPSSK